MHVYIEGDIHFYVNTPNQYMNGMSMHIYLCIPPPHLCFCVELCLFVSLFQNHMTKGLKRISGENLKVRDSERF